MPIFNRSLVKKSSSLVKLGYNALNRAGGFAFQDSPQMALYRQVATSLWSGDGYYEKQEEWLKRFQQNVTLAMNEDVRFPFALAAYARDKAGLALRTSPIALYVEAATNETAKNTGYIRSYAPKVLLRADEPAEAIAYFRKYHQGVIPHGILRGIADALKNFDEYQLAKYKKTGQISMRDVFRLARPKPATDVENNLWNRVVTQTLETPYTWEVEISKCTTNEEKRQKWNELIYSKKLGLFALVRNIRNILKYGADIEEAFGQITQERVRNSGILPFQWYKASKAIVEAGGGILATQMQQALAWSLDIVPKLQGITLIACDNSGSMFSAFSTRGMSHAEIGNLMGAMALYCCEDGIASTFGEIFDIADTDPRVGIFGNKERIDKCGSRTGHSTNAWKIFEYLIRERIYVDRIILFSDMQCYDSGARYYPNVVSSHTLSAEFSAYQSLNPAVRLYSVNLASQDNSCQFSPEQKVIELAGWSESIFQFINSLEAGENIIDEILKNY